jgi:hypothetical protein
LAPHKFPDVSRDPFLHIHKVHPKVDADNFSAVYARKFFHVHLNRILDKFNEELS